MADLKVGDIKKAVDFAKAENPNWKRAEARIKELLEKPQNQPKTTEQGLKPVMTKSFKYSCPSCGHSDVVRTIGGHGQPEKWGCRKCGKDTTDIKPHTEQLAPKMTEAQWKQYRSNPDNTKPLSAFHTGDPKIEKMAQMHYQNPKHTKVLNPNSNYHWTDCGEEVHKKYMSTDASKVTCGKCKAQLNKVKPIQGPTMKSEDKGTKTQSKVEEWKKWAAERVKDAEAGKFKSDDSHKATAQKIPIHEQQQPIVNAMPSKNKKGDAWLLPVSLRNLKLLEEKPSYMKNSDDECPKCGGRMTQGAPHVAGNVKQSECHNCGHTIVTQRGA